MADRYWVNSGNWDDIANWSTTSGGGGGASVPTTGDTAIFDANSPLGDDVIITSSVDCAIDIDVQKSTYGAVWYSPEINDIAIVVDSGGSLTLQADLKVLYLGVSGTGTLISNGYEIEVVSLIITDAATIDFSISFVSILRGLTVSGSSIGSITINGGSFTTDDDTNIFIKNATITGSELIAYALTSDGNIDGGSNVNLTFSLSGTLRYWVGQEGGSWNDIANWAISSGGTGGTSVPLISGDVAVFDSLSFSGYYKTIAIQNCSVACEIVNSTALPFILHVQIGTSLGDSTLSLQNDINIYQIIINDSFVSNDFWVRSQYFMCYAADGVIPSIALGSSSFTISAFLNQYTPTFYLSSDVTTGAEEAIVTLCCLYGAYNRYEAHTMIGNLYVQLIGALDLYVENASFAELCIYGYGNVCIVDDDTTINMVGESEDVEWLVIEGLNSDEANRISFGPYNAESTVTFSMAHGSSYVTNCTFKNCIATGGATFTALITDGNIDDGGNIGWIFYPTSGLIPMLHMYGEIDAFFGIKVPQLRLNGSLTWPNIQGVVSVPLVWLDVSMKGGRRTISGASILPIVDVAGIIHTCNNLSANASMSCHAISASATGGGYAALKLAKIAVVSVSSTDAIARLQKATPRITISAMAFTADDGVLQSQLPAVRILANGYLSPIASVNRSILPVRLSASAINGLLGNLSKTIPAVIVLATAHQSSAAQATLSIPSVNLRSSALNGTLLTLSMNTKNLALTQYDNFEYNSLAVFNEKVIGSKADGIYELTGTKDNSTNIAWNFKTGKIDTEDGIGHNVRHAWISYDPSGDLTLVVDDGVHEYEYAVTAYSQIDNTVRVKIGKGLRGKYIQLELKNIANEKIFLDRLRLFTQPLGAKQR